MSEPGAHRCGRRLKQAKADAIKAGYSAAAVNAIGRTPSDVFLFSKLPEADQQAILRQATKDEFDRYINHAHTKPRVPMRQERAGQQVEAPAPAPSSPPATVAPTPRPATPQPLPASAHDLCLGRAPNVQCIGHSLDSINAAHVCEAKSQGLRATAIAKALGIGPASVYRVLEAGH
jgi:hypothetical protein